MIIKNDSVERTLQLLRDRWTFLVLRETFFGVRRFDQMQRNLDIARNILTDRLRLLVEAEILTRQLYNEHPPRYEYRLTEKGRDLYPIVLELLRWGDKWTAGVAGPPLLLFHKKCGNKLTPLTVCDHCRQPVNAADVTYEPGRGDSKDSQTDQ